VVEGKVLQGVAVLTAVVIPSENVLTIQHNSGTPEGPVNIAVQTDDGRQRIG
jgi:hypothetical protein